jgi:hypothetical protein
MNIIKRAICRLFHCGSHQRIAGTTFSKRFWKCSRCLRHFTTKRPRGKF